MKNSFSFWLETWLWVFPLSLIVGPCAMEDSDYGENLLVCRTQWMLKNRLHWILSTGQHRKYKYKYIKLMLNDDRYFNEILTRWPVYGIEIRPDTSDYNELSIYFKTKPTILLREDCCYGYKWLRNNAYEWLKENHIGILAENDPAVLFKDEPKLLLDNNLPHLIRHQKLWLVNNHPDLLFDKGEEQDRLMMMQTCLHWVIENRFEYIATKFSKLAILVMPDKLVAEYPNIAFAQNPMYVLENNPDWVRENAPSYFKENNSERILNRMNYSSKIYNP